MNDDDLTREALESAVADVEPADRLDAIRARTSRRPRRTSYAVGAAVLAAAAVVVAVAVVGSQVGSRSGPGPSGTAGPAPTDVDTPPPAALTSPPPTSPTTPATPTGPTRTVALYFVGDTPEGERLFREFRAVPDFDPARDYLEPVLDALATPDDPDYRSAWPAGSVVAQVVEGEVRVQLPDDADRSLVALQQLRDTLAAATGLESMTFYRGPSTLTVERDDDLLADVSISDPVEGRVVGDTFTARGVADAHEGTVLWRVVDGSGEVLLADSVTADGSGRLFPWRARVDVSGLPPGDYTFEASTTDPSDGEGPGTTTDTRSITVT